MEQQKPFHTDNDEIEQWARCNFLKPHTSFAATAAKILVSQTGISLDELSPETYFYSINVYDCFDSVDYVNALEIKFGIAISDEDAKKLVTFGELIDYLHRMSNAIAPRKLS